MYVHVYINIYMICMRVFVNTCIGISICVSHHRSPSWRQATQSSARLLAAAGMLRKETNTCSSAEDTASTHNQKQSSGP